LRGLNLVRSQCRDRLVLVESRDVVYDGPVVSVAF
jgi:hypothetical protein